MKWFNSKKIKWLDSNRISVDDVLFYVIRDFSELSLASTSNLFLLGKPRSMVEKYIDLLKPMSIQKIFELGIFKGGSSVFFHALCRPEKLVVIEYDREEVTALGDYIQKKKCQKKLIPYYGVNQADRESMLHILEKEFHDKNIDLVIDDASHFLDETRRSFNIIVPFVRPGGLYIIEDWAWSHAPFDMYQKPGGKYSDKPALTNLVFEIIMSCPSTPGLIDEIVIDKHNVIITKGGGENIPETFDISDSYLTRGKKFISSL